MQLTKSYIKDYNEFNDNFQLILPLNLEYLIPGDNSVRLLSPVWEGLDYKKLYKAYSSVGRKPAVEPKIMFKIISYAYSQNIYSSRKIEKDRYAFVLKKAILKNEEKMFDKILALLETINLEELKEFIVQKERKI